MIIEELYGIPPKSEYTFFPESESDPLYHHSCKGCKIEIRVDNRFTIGTSRRMQYLYCKTHNVFCSKTGWLFHLWGGKTDSRELK